MNKVSTNGVLEDIEVCGGYSVPTENGVEVPPNSASRKTSSINEPGMIEIKLEGKGYKNKEAKEVEGR